VSPATVTEPKTRKPKIDTVSNAFGPRANFVNLTYRRRPRVNTKNPTRYKWYSVCYSRRYSYNGYHGGSEMFVYGPSAAFMNIKSLEGRWREGETCLDEKNETPNIIRNRRNTLQVRPRFVVKYNRTNAVERVVVSFRFRGHVLRNVSVVPCRTCGKKSASKIEPPRSLSSGNPEKFPNRSRFFEPLHTNRVFERD